MGSEHVAGMTTRFQTDPHARLAEADARRVEAALQALSAMHCYATLAQKNESPAVRELGDDVRKLLRETMDALRMLGCADDAPEPYLSLVRP